MRKFFTPKIINLKANGTAKCLGELESKIMEIIWQESSATVRGVRDQLARQKRELSFNSVMTVMNRLVDKGLLKKCHQGSVYTYCPTLSQTEFSRRVVKDIISSVIKDPALFGTVSFTQLLASLDKEALKGLKKSLIRD